MGLILITGSGGLIGSEAAEFFHAQGFDVVGLDNDMRQYFFGPEASTQWRCRLLNDRLPRYRHVDCDIRSAEAINKIFAQYGSAISAVIHAAAQPSHDWAAREPHTDFAINASGTLNLLEATRLYAPEASFIFTSTNKVYGDRPNTLPLLEEESRWEIALSHPYHQHGIDETMSIDQCTHSVFGASKVAADIMVQEYGRYFGMNTAVFRGGCLTGPSHSGAMLHGFLAYLVRCAVTGTPYTIFGYKGKQVRDNLHSQDLIAAFMEVIRAPKPAAVYNIGGGRHSNCSVLEAIAMIQMKLGREIRYSLSGENRTGDHIWWISDIRRFQSDYPSWSMQWDLDRIVDDIIEGVQVRHGG